MTNVERYNVQVTRSRWYFGSKLPKTRDVTHLPLRSGRSLLYGPLPRPQ